jgi:membrane protease YdiL (CAAX protease family)
MDINIILIYGFLLFSVISVWIPFKLFSKIPLWLLFLAISFILAIIFERASFVSLVYTVIFGFSVYYYYKKKNILLFFLVLALSIPLISHFSILDFNNYSYLQNINLTIDSTPYSLYFNLDKTLIGIFIIAFSFEYKRIEFLPIFKLLIINLLIMAVIFFVLSAVFGYSKFEPKLPPFTPVWILVNLFFTCVAEEALFRKLIQQKVYDSLSGKYALATSIFVASLIMLIELLIV